MRPFCSNYYSTTDGAGAFAYYPGSTASTDQSGDVYLNTQYVSTDRVERGGWSYYVIMHEVGHALGLSHPGDYNAAPGTSITYANNAQFSEDSYQYTLMSYFRESNTSGSFSGGYSFTPMLLDIYAMQQIYGANTTTRAGNTVYGFNCNAGVTYDFSLSTTPVLCIWDAGGVDTLDASGYSRNQIINLNEGAFSSLGNSTTNYGAGYVNSFKDNVSIAVGAVIENAIGGSGDDVLVANTVNNILTGGLGNDTYLFYSGFGQDIINETGTGTDLIEFGSGITAQDLSYAQSGNNLLLSAANNNITLSNWYSTNSIEQLRFDESGTYWNFQSWMVGNHLPTLTGVATELSNGSENTPYTITKAQLLQGWTDADDDTLSITTLGADHGVVIDNGNATYTVTPASNYNGVMHLSYNVEDSYGNGVAAALQFNVGAVNSAPTLVGSTRGDGKLTTDFGGSDAAYSVTVQADGKILVAGDSNSNFALARYNSDGSLDNSFDTDGKLTTSTGSRARSMVLQADGKILVAGGSSDFVVARYNSDGSLDNSFDGDGKLTTNFGDTDYGFSLTLQADGKILLAGLSGNDFALARYNKDGSLDSSFDGDGMLTTDFGTTTDYGRSVTVQADGKILLAGLSGNYFALARYNSDGSLDASFDGDGKLTAPGPVATTVDVAVQADGKILLTGNGLLRYNSDGSLDSSFDGDGKLLGAFAADSVTVQADGKILTAGSVFDAVNSYDLALARYNSDGSPDSSFDGDGKLVTGFGGWDEAKSVMLQADGKILVAGLSTKNPSTSDFNRNFALVRYNSDGSLDTSFDVIRYVQLGAAVIIDDAISAYDLDLALSGNYAGASVTLTRHGGASAEDVFATAGGLSFSNGKAVLNGTVIGDVINSGGVLTLTFNASTTQALLNKALSSITYANNSNTTPPSFVQLDWLFSDGNTGVQGGGGSLAASVASTVVITAKAPTITSGVTGTITENAPISTVIYDANATDPDAGQTATLRYSLTGTDAVWLNINATNGQVTLKSSADFESKASYSFNVIATDTDGLKAEKAVTVSVSNVNDAPTFKVSNGIVTTDVGSLFYDDASSIAMQADGKILVAGTSTGISDDFALVRYNSNGSLDTSFSGDGKVTTDIGSLNDKGRSVIVQADGKILVVGDSGAEGNHHFGLVRYNPDGSLDTGFSGDGKVTTVVGYSDVGQSVTVQEDGKILMAGSSFNGSYGDFVLTRYNSNGSLDTSFSGDGKVTTAVGLEADLGYSIAMQADGKVLVGGTSLIGSNYDFALVRYNSNGSLDTTFGGGDGKVTTDMGFLGDDSGSSVTVQADGKILVAGYARFSAIDDDFALTRYNLDGSLDTSFDGDGKVTTDIGSLNDKGRSVIVQADGKILVAGTSYNGSNDDFALVRYNSNGSLDTTFGGGDGKVTTDMGFLGDDSGSSVTVQADGKILVAGTGKESSINGYFALIRYNSDGSLDTTFGEHNALGRAVYFTEGSGAALLAKGATVSDSELNATNYNGAILTLARHGGANAEDVFSSTAFSGSNVIVSGTTIGTLTQVNGSLVMLFNTLATQALVNKALQGIKYSNSSDVPPASVQIDWTFNDGNTGAQGIGGALTTLGSTTVNIIAVNDAPTGIVTVSGTALLGQVLTASHTLTDRDGMGNVSYQWRSIDKGIASDIAGATGSTLKLTSAQVGKWIEVVVTYTDGCGTLELVKSSVTLVPNLVIGTINNDTLTGSIGADRFEGLAGNDTYIINHLFDTVIENTAAGTDLVKSSFNFTLSANLENLALTGTAAINGTGNELANIITGNSGNNILDGGAGADNLIGGLGSDTYIVDVQASGDIQDTITENASAGIDTLILRGVSTNTTEKTLTLATNLENLDASATGSSKLHLIGNANNNTLTGNDFNNTINGGGGNDILVGGAGNDNLNGGAGRDTYVFNPINTSNNGGLGLDIIVSGGFVTDKDSILETEEDILDLSDIFANGAVNVNNLSQYLQMSGTTLQIDRDGSGTNYAFTNLVTISGSSVTNNHLDELLTAGQIVV